MEEVIDRDESRVEDDARSSGVGDGDGVEGEVARYHVTSVEDSGFFGMRPVLRSELSSIYNKS